MNKIFLPATAAVLSFGVASSALASVPHVARYPHEMVMAGAAAHPKSLRGDPTGLPAYLMRSDGLMTNGLLPNNGWQG
jgi:hypothetical protein